RLPARPPRSGIPPVPRTFRQMMEESPNIGVHQADTELKSGALPKARPTPPLHPASEETLMEDSSEPEPSLPEPCSPGKAPSPAGLDESSDMAGELEEPPPSAAIPERLGHFELVEKLGQGGMGYVYLARDAR